MKARPALAAWLRDGDAATSWLARLPQEDCCQATGTPGERRYESDGGPGVEKCLSILAAGNNPAADALTFAKAPLAFWLLAAIDGHAKNFSVFLIRTGHHMTPLYDVLSAWPIIGRESSEIAVQAAKLAMAIRGSRPYRHLQRISVRHWRALAMRTGVDGAFGAMVNMVEQAGDALARVEGALPPGFPAEVWERLFRGVHGQRRHFLDVLALEA